MSMPGGLPTPPTESETAEQVQESSTVNSVTKPSPKIIIPTSTMQRSLASLTCATPLDALNSDRVDPNSGNPSGVVATPELLAVGELVAAMKIVLGALGTTFDALGDQTARVASLGPALKAAEQVKKLRADLSEQIREQEKRTLEVKLLLEQAVKQSLTEELKTHIHSTVEREVVERVKHQLNTQIPENLRKRVKSHKRQFSSAARQYNSALGPTALTDELRPLLRPLPSAEQSPANANVGGTTVPPTPIPEEIVPTASPLFPRDLKALFSLKTEDALSLVKEYGLGEKVQTPSTPTAEAASANDRPDSRERNLNRFMSHIGVRRRVPNARLPQLHVTIPGGTEVSFATYY
ncbi:hypothetical protein B0H10DRAFT_2101776 [Mycena sp. CBHHK59/15]|nr:hypothetical protein B0H10DRAFT_2101776 [Mycena sp. CBHHK59/15]